MKKALIFIILAIIVVAGTAGFFILKKFTKTDSATVYAEEAERRDVSSIVTCFGQVKPRVEVEISAKITGEIVELYVEEGDSVNKGDPLLDIEPKVFEARVEQARASYQQSEAALRQQIANLKQLELDLDRNKQMFAKDMISKNQLEQLETQFQVQQSVVESSRRSVERAQSMLDEAIEELSYTRIVSPQKGIVIGLQREVGEYVIVGTMNNPGSIIMTIAQLDSMEVEVQVDETDIVYLKENQPVNISFDAIPDTTFGGEVRKIGNKAYIQSTGQNETIANFLVTIAILEIPENIRSGMSVTAEIITETADSAVSVPIQCVVTGLTSAEEGRQKFSQKDKNKDGNEGDRDDGKKDQKGIKVEEKEYVFVLEEGKAKKVEVKTGIADENYIVIESGLDEGEKVITGPYKELRQLYEGKMVTTTDRWGGGDEKKGFSISVSAGK